MSFKRIIDNKRIIIHHLLNASHPTLSTDRSSRESQKLKSSGEISPRL